MFKISTIEKLFLVAVAFLFFSFLPISRYIKKAEKQVEKGNMKEAKVYYLKAIAKDPNNYKANLGLGLLLTELQDQYAEAIPYLENACKFANGDTLSDVKYALAKCYQSEEQYENAIYYLSRLNGLVAYDNEINFTMDIEKRITDCKFALDRKFEKPDEKVCVVNAGKKINTEYPEYVPVLTPNGELIFTSKRKDNKFEGVNYLDGKYFESVYVSKMDSTGFKQSERYNGLDKILHAHFGRKHECLLSVTGNGHTWYVFSDNKIYEVKLQDWKVQSIKKMEENINFNAYQNHAFLTKNGKQLFFTSDANGGRGGNDIYISTKNENNEWQKPVNLGDSINTAFDEEAPFLSNDGNTLYFASKGHPGYGNFDMYKSEFKNGKWGGAVNLGKPINSPANDIFFVSDSLENIAYIASSRKGGVGDMDIYKIMYADKIDKRCKSFLKYPVSLKIQDNNAFDFENTVQVNIPANYKMIDYEWKVDNQITYASSHEFKKDYLKNGTHTVEYKLTAFCDTCVMPVVSCSQISNKIERKLDTGSVAKHNQQNTTLTKFDLKNKKGILNHNELEFLGYNNDYILFEKNSSALTNEASALLNINLKVLKKHSTLFVEILGFADARGSEEHNLELSQRRAESIRSYLIRKGLKKSQIKLALGKGALDVDENCGEDKDCIEKQHQLNRRAIINVINK